MRRLGELERRVMDVLWDSETAPLTGREVADQLPDGRTRRSSRSSSACVGRTWSNAAQTAGRIDSRQPTP